MSVKLNCIGKPVCKKSNGHDVKRVLIKVYENWLKHIMKNTKNIYILMKLTHKNAWLMIVMCYKWKLIEVHENWIEHIVSNIKDKREYKSSVKLIHMNGLITQENICAKQNKKKK